MSDVAVLDAGWPLDISLFVEGGHDPDKSTWLSETDQELTSFAAPPSGTGAKTLYEFHEFLYHKMIVGANSLPFSVLVATRSEITQDSSTFLDSHPEIIRAYEERLGFLEKAGLTEGIELNIDSETDFWEFIDTPLISRKAELVFIGEGNIRAIWEDEDDNFLGLHFLGNRKIIYVIFKQHPDGKDTTIETGVESFGGTKKKIVQFCLTHLVNA